MNIVINKIDLKKVLDYHTFYGETVHLLNTLVDNELNKPDDEIDFDFIDECTETLLEINGCIITPEQLAFKIGSSKQILFKAGETGFKSLSTVLKISLVAAAIFAVTISANAAIGSITGTDIIERIVLSNEKEQTTAVHQETTEKSVLTKTTEDYSALITEKETTMPETEPDSNGDDSVFVRKSPITTAKNGLIKKRYNSIGDKKTSGKSISSYSKDYDILVPRFADVDFDEDLPENFSESDEMLYIIENYGPKYMLCEATDFTKKCKFSDWAVTVEPTCGALGEKEEICSVCGKVIKVPCAATGKHKFKLKKLVEPASVEGDGTLKFSCSKCNLSFEQEIPAPKYFVLNTDSFVYNGKNNCPKVIAVLDNNGNAIPSKYYSEPVVNDGSDFGGRYPGMYMMKVYFKGDYYDGSISVDFSVVPSKIELRSISACNGAFIARWNSGEKAPSLPDWSIYYQLEYSNSESFENSKTIRIEGLLNTSKEVTSLVSGETYYVRVRFCCNDGFELCGDWSDVRKITVK